MTAFFLHIGDGPWTMDHTLERHNIQYSMLNVQLSSQSDHTFLLGPT